MSKKIVFDDLHDHATKTLLKFGFGYLLKGRIDEWVKLLEINLAECKSFMQEQADNATDQERCENS